MTRNPPVARERAEARPTILVVEDEILIRLDTADTLREQGNRVLEAADAAEALALLKTDKDIALVVTDVQMPGEIDGVDLTRVIKATWSRIPVVIVSGHLPAEKAKEADRFLRKPVSGREIARVAKELVNPLWQNRKSNFKAS